MLHNRSLGPQKSLEHLQGRTGASRNKGQRIEIQERTAWLKTELSIGKPKMPFLAEQSSGRRKELGSRWSCVKMLTRLGVSQSRNGVWYFLVLFHSYASHSTRVLRGCHAIAGRPAPTPLGNLHPQLCEESASGIAQAPSLWDLVYP